MTARNPLGSLNPNAVFERLVELGETWAEADATASFLEETKKSLLARLVNEIGAESRMSITAATNLALASEEYRQHLRAMVDARKAATKARVRYDSGKVWADHARSANANRRAEITMGSLGS